MIADEMTALRSLPSFGLALALTVGALAPGAEARPAPSTVEPRIVPNRDAMVPPYQVNGSAIELTMNGVRIRAEPLDENRRETWFRLRSTLRADPLPRRTAHADGFTVFEVSLENHGIGTLTFSPAVAGCWYDKDHDLRPLHVDLLLEILRAFHGAESADLGPIMTELLATFHAEPLLLAPGQRASRLLVFRGAPAKAKSLRLDLIDIEAGPHVIHPIFLFNVSEPRETR
jgi:hypothetical protein